MSFTELQFFKPHIEKVNDGTFRLGPNSESHIGFAEVGELYMPDAYWWHVDPYSGDEVERRSLLSIGASAAPPWIAYGNVVLEEINAPTTRNHQILNELLRNPFNTTDYRSRLLSMVALLYGYDWVEIYSDKFKDLSVELPDGLVACDLWYEQLEPLTVATGIDYYTLHKGGRRSESDPSVRVLHTSGIVEVKPILFAPEELTSR